MDFSVNKNIPSLAGVWQFESTKLFAWNNRIFLSILFSLLGRCYGYSLIEVKLHFSVACFKALSAIMSGRNIFGLYVEM